MSQKPTGAEAVAAREQAELVDATVTAVLAQNALRAGRTEDPLFFVSFGVIYKHKDHPVLGKIDPSRVIGLRAPYLELAELWVKHWLGRAYSEVMTYDDWWSRRKSFPGGCPLTYVVPPCRRYVHSLGAQIVVWEVPDGPALPAGVAFELEAYTPQGKKKQTSATPQTLLEGHGAWRQVWYSFDGERLTRAQVNEICTQAGLY